MSKKKSYMDKNNILTENKLLKFINNIIPFKDLIKKSFTSKDKDILKDPKVKKSLDTFEKKYKAYMKSAEETKKWLKTLPHRHGKDRVR
jgi:hypothetical protein